MPKKNTSQEIETNKQGKEARRLRDLQVAEARARRRASREKTKAMLDQINDAKVPAHREEPEPYLSPAQLKEVRRDKAKTSRRSTLKSKRRDARLAKEAFQNEKREARRQENKAKPWPVPIRGRNNDLGSNEYRRRGPKNEYVRLSDEEAKGYLFSKGWSLNHWVTATGLVRPYQEARGSRRTRNWYASHGIVLDMQRVAPQSNYEVWTMDYYKYGTLVSYKGTLRQAYRHQFGLDAAGVEYEPVGRMRLDHETPNVPGPDGN